MSHHATSKILKQLYWIRHLAAACPRLTIKLARRIKQIAISGIRDLNYSVNINLNVTTATVIDIMKLLTIISHFINSLNY